VFHLKRSKYRSLADEEILQLIRNQSDERAFETLYERYIHLVYGVCLKYVKDEYEAEEITSKVFVELTNKICRFEIAHFKSWLHTVTKNECYMFLRKQKHIFTNDGLELLREKEPEQLEEKEIQLDHLEQALKELKPPQDACVKLFYLENKSYQEIAELLTLSIKHVKSAIQNGKRNLKLILEKTNAFNIH
jgi:RNA polymerase sigma-70 factor (ECF subfamily)